MDRNTLNKTVRRAFGGEVRRFRQQLGLTVPQMAEQLGLSDQGQWKLERGSVFVGPGVLLALRRQGVDINVVLDAIPAIEAENDNQPEAPPEPVVRRAHGRERVE